MRGPGSSARRSRCCWGRVGGSTVIAEPAARAPCDRGVRRVGTGGRGRAGAAGESEGQCLGAGRRGVLVWPRGVREELGPLACFPALPSAVASVPRRGGNKEAAGAGVGTARSCCFPPTPAMINRTVGKGASWGCLRGREREGRG